MPSILSKTQKQDICDRYLAGESGCALARDYNVHKTTVLKFLTRRGVPRHSDHIHRVHTMNHRYFEKIDTPEKAFFLGLIAADGCNHGNGVITMVCKTSDRAILVAFKKATDSTVPVYDYSAKTGFSNRDTGQKSVFSFTSHRMKADLEKAGINPRKSLSALAWDGSEELLSHYWRGVWAGDGWIFRSAYMRGKHNRDYWTVGLCGSEAMMISFRAWVKENCQIDMPLYQTGKIWQTKVAGIAKPQKVMALLLTNSSINLERKDLLARELLSRFVTDRRRQDIPTGQQIRDEYDAGASMEALAKKYTCSLTCIRARITESGGTIRSRSEANRNRYSKDAEISA